MKKVLTIIGPTAIGKTKLSIDLANSLDGEIISADSRQVYKGLDIGSDKIKEGDMKGVPHHMLSIVNPKKIFTAKDYEKKGSFAIKKIQDKNKLPIIVGGTGFYINALLNKNYICEVEPNKRLRNKLAKLSLEELREELKKRNEECYNRIDLNNPHRIIRAIEILESKGEVPNKKIEKRFDAIKIGLTMPLSFLYSKIEKRLEKTWYKTIEEVKKLHKDGISIERLKELGLQYKYASMVVTNEKENEEAFKNLLSELKKYAKRQITWFNRDPEIKWFPVYYEDEITEYIKNRLRE